MKNGKYSSGIQKYKCTECHKTFNILTNTIFHNHKISISEWIEFLLYLFGYESTNAISKSNRNSHSTTKYWIKKLFFVVKDYQNDIVLKGDVYIDEAFYKFVKSEIKYKDVEQNIEYRGLSKNQIYIGVAKDENKIFAKVEGFGKTDNEKTLNTFKEHIKQGSKIIRDSEKSHNSLISCLNLSSESYNGNDLKKLNDEDNPLDPINKTILYIRKFLNAYSGFDRDELQGYLDLFAFISNEKGTLLDKVNKIVDLSINKRISLKYRE